MKWIRCRVRLRRLITTTDGQTQRAILKGTTGTAIVITKEQTGGRLGQPFSADVIWDATLVNDTGAAGPFVIQDWRERVLLDELEFVELEVP